jgi:hypothetical protein
MKRIAISVTVLVALGLTVCGGYWLGFRQGWNLGLQVEAPLRATLAIGHLGFLEKGQLAFLKTSYESEVDTGLMWWAHVEDDPNYRFLNVLSGHDVVPQYERYVTRVATYRKANKSPLRDPAMAESMLKSAREADPVLARALEEGWHEADLAIDRMVKKYGQ